MINLRNDGPAPGRRSIIAVWTERVDLVRRARNVKRRVADPELTNNRESASREGTSAVHAMEIGHGLHQEYRENAARVPDAKDSQLWLAVTHPLMLNLPGQQQNGLSVR